MVALLVLIIIFLLAPGLVLAGGAVLGWLFSTMGGFIVLILGLNFAAYLLWLFWLEPLLDRRSYEQAQQGRDDDRP